MKMANEISNNIVKQMVIKAFETLPRRDALELFLQVQEMLLGTTLAGDVPTKRQEAQGSQETDNKGGRKDAKRQGILDALKASPGMEPSKLAKVVYGDDSEDNIKRLRSMLSTMKSLGLVIDTARNTWEVVTPKRK
jgi:hypothetical protein